MQPRTQKRKLIAAACVILQASLMPLSAYAEPRPIVQFLEESNLQGGYNRNLFDGASHGTTGELLPLDSLLTSNSVRVWWSADNFSDHTFWKDGHIDPAIKTLLQPSRLAADKASSAEWLAFGGGTADWAGWAGFWGSTIYAALQVVDLLRASTDPSRALAISPDDVKGSLARATGAFGLGIALGMLGYIRPVCEGLGKEHADEAIRLWNAGK
jgi:hypothetical protein